MGWGGLAHEGLRASHDKQIKKRIGSGMAGRRTERGLGRGGGRAKTFEVGGRRVDSAEKKRPAMDRATDHKKSAMDRAIEPRHAWIGEATWRKKVRQDSHKRRRKQTTFRRCTARQVAKLRCPFVIYLSWGHPETPSPPRPPPTAGTNACQHLVFVAVFNQSSMLFKRLRASEKFGLHLCHVVLPFAGQIRCSAPL